MTPVPSLSRLHLSSLHHHLVPELLSSWEDIITKESGEEYIKGESDTFVLDKQDSRWSLDSVVKALPISDISGGNEKHAADQLGGNDTDCRILDFSKITKRLVTYDTEWPETKETPYFNHNAFYANLRYYQDEKSSEAEEFGKFLMYGEVVTSTNTILEK
jgi:biotin---protein ligase